MASINVTSLSATTAVRVLNRVLRLLCRSLPMYLVDAQPWTPADGEPQAQAALDRLVADRRLLAGRVADAIQQQGGQPEPGSFPIAYTAINDASLDFLLQRVIDELCGQMSSIENPEAELAGNADLQALAEEVLGNTQAHLSLLAAAARKSGD